MSGPRCVLDACVLYPTVLRDILIGVCARGLLCPLWSDRLFEEWVRTAARRGGALDEALARGETARLNAAFATARVRHAPPDEAALWLPDPGDIHVLATAIAGSADMIVTLNLRDFPRRELAAHGLVARHPDAVMMDLWLAAPDIVVDTVGAVHDRARAAADPAANMALRPLLKRARLPRLAKAIAPWA